MKRFSSQEAEDYLAVIRHRKKVHNLRLGQAILNENVDLGSCPEVYYCTDDQRVLAWFYANLVGKGEVGVPTDTSMVVSDDIRSQRRTLRRELTGISKANRFGAIK